MKIVDLSGTWNLSRCGTRPGSELSSLEERTVPMRVPGDNFTALIESGLIPDPYFGTNELRTLWVGREDWLISRTFTLEPELLDDRQLFLHADCLDTFAEIRINGTILAESVNMFTALRAEAGHLLRPGTNRIDILFRSAERQAAELSRRLPYTLPHTSYPVQSPYRNLVRKVQCHAGWDWGPCLMVSGVYGNIYVASCSVGRIGYVTTAAVRRGRRWELTVEVEYLASREASMELEISVADTRLARRVEVNPGPNRVRETLLVRDCELWWPVGWGRQALYELTVTMGPERIEKRIGFRTLELEQAGDEAGRGMIFVVNGRRIFCKGANWIPPDALPARQTRKRYEALLSDAVTANMNMLRVWGGGQYESEDFYGLCDEKGLLVWQDFMFSCSTYPAEAWFLDSVAEEVRHQVRRLMQHPCVVLWCGNNENVGALGWFPESREQPERYRRDYERLNDEVVGTIVRELDPGRPWWPSSPSAGPGDYADNWHDDRKGDMHFWSVWHEGRSFDAYCEVTPRFCSEFGFQSFPSLDTVRRFAPADQWNVTAPVMEHHQRSPRGNTVIVETMCRYFRLPESFEGFLYLSQVQQALAIKTAVEYWRSRRPWCMGTLYWQLNDLWPGASWSSIEHSGKWKLLHYAARKFYAPVHVAAWYTDGRTVQIIGLNDTSSAVTGALRLRLIGFDGDIRFAEELAVTLQPEAATPLYSLEVADLPAGPEEAFLSLAFVPEGAAAGAPGTSARVATPAACAPVANELFFAPFKRCPLEEPSIGRRIDLEQGRVIVELRAERPAFFVSLDAGEIQGVFDDNLFTLLPGERKTVGFTARGEQTPSRSVESLEEKLQLFHLRGTYT